eukprot:comp22515_c1_seq1/m.34122 comp22515_c1_seq1/g.34122  ORF comp22515_c1_seq1/g.34122 comp22515_c1_seq1/m.34122 type:complete len:678 (-) comp22515_c1_seq1:89-2122(-)
MAIHELLATWTAFHLATGVGLSLAQLPADNIPPLNTTDTTSISISPPLESITPVISPQLEDLTLQSVQSGGDVDGTAQDVTVAGVNVAAVQAESFRADGRCGVSFKAPNGKAAICNPDDRARPCCSPTGYCGNSVTHCTGKGVDYRITWRSDNKCGAANLNSLGLPATCNPDSSTPCCSAGGVCGNTNDHCLCSTCLDYSKGWRRYNGADAGGKPIKSLAKATVNTCKAECIKTQECGGFSWNGIGCTLKDVTGTSELIVAQSDSFVIGLPKLRFSTDPVLKQSKLDFTRQALTNIAKVAMAPKDPDELGLFDEPGYTKAQISGDVSAQAGVWTNWGACTGTCGYMTRTRTCTSAWCDGSSVQRCVVLSQCCTYTRSGPPATKPTLLVPFYVAPLASGNMCTHPQYLRLARGCKGVQAIVNLSNGPGGPSSDWAIPHFKACLNMLAGHGIQLYGYVHTKTNSFDPYTGIFSYTGMRAHSDVMADVDTWINRYFNQIPNFVGFFLDEVSNTYQFIKRDYGVDHLWHYREIVKFIKGRSTNYRVVMNGAGSMPAELFSGYSNPADMPLFFEQSIDRWQPWGPCINILWTQQYGSFPPGPYCGYVPVADAVEPLKSLVDSNTVKGTTLVYGCDANRALLSIDQAANQNVKFHYTSHRSLWASPWNELPWYWDDLLRKIMT